VSYLSLSRSLRREMDLTLSTEAERLIMAVDLGGGGVHLGEGPDNLRIGTLAALYDTTGSGY
jgi:hypothetical protein